MAEMKAEMMAETKVERRVYLRVGWMVEMSVVKMAVTKVGW